MPDAVDDDPAQELVGEAELLESGRQRTRRAVGQGIATGTMSDQSSAIARLFGGLSVARRHTIAFDLADERGRGLVRRRR